MENSFLTGEKEILSAFIMARHILEAGGDMVDADENAKKYFL